MRFRMAIPKPGGGDPAGTTQWSEIAGKPQIYSCFPIWAEESASLNSGAFEWAYGNGNDTPNGVGIVLPFDCELFSVGLTLEGNTTCTVEVRKNTESSGKSVSTSSSKKAINTFEDDPVAYSAGDVVNFRTITGSSGSYGGVAVAWFRRLVE